MDVISAPRNIPPCKPCEDVRIPNTGAKGKEAKPKDKFFPLPGKKKVPGNGTHKKEQEPKPCPDGGHGPKAIPDPLKFFVDPKKSFLLEDFLKLLPKEDQKKFLEEYHKFQSHPHGAISDLVLRYPPEEREKIRHFFDNYKRPL